MSLAPVSFSIDGKSVHIDGWQFNDTEGGYDQLSGVMTLTDYLRLGSPTQGEAVKAHEGDEVRWAGRFAAPPQIKEGRAYFNALGYKEALAKKTQRLLFQSADMSQWVPFDADPHGGGATAYEHSRKWNLDTTNHAIRFSLARNQTLNANDGIAAIFYAEGVEIQRVKWTQDYNVADEFPKLEIKVQRANGPTGAANNVTTGGAPVALNGTNNGSTQDISHAIAGQDIIMLVANCNDATFAPNADKMVWTLSSIRVNSDITSGDSFNGYEVVDYVADQMGWDTTGIAAVTFDVLPLDWIDGDWLGLLLYIAEMEDKYVRVGDEAVEYDDWGATNWNVTGAGARPDLKPLELFNQARVTFETASGVQRKRLAHITDYLGFTDPLASSGITNTVEYELEDRQKNNTLADNVAEKLVKRFSQQRYEGTVDVVAATADDGRTNPRGIRYGDTITVSDWAAMTSQTLRVMEVAQGPDSVTVGVEQPVNIAALVAHTSAGKRRRGGHGKRGGHGMSQTGP